MTFTIGFLGDAMLGRKVGERIADDPEAVLVGPGVVDAARAVDVLVANLECCISDRGSRWPDPRKAFFFRAPPAAVGTLVRLGVDVVTLANNHALDFGPEALTDTFRHLTDAGIRWTGAGRTLREARAPVQLARGGRTLALVGCSDHPADYAAGQDTAGIAFTDLRRGPGTWVEDTIRGIDADVVAVTPHWGPNMTTAPPPHVRLAADSFAAAGADVVAGHSAHVFHGVRFVSWGRAPGIPVLYDLGDFLDDYAVDATLRNDLGAFWKVTLDGATTTVSALPLVLDYCETRLADGDDRKWVVDRLRAACAEFRSHVVDEGEWLHVRPPSAP